MKNIIILTCLICVISCKSEIKSKENNEVIKEANVSKQYKKELVVKINIEYLKNDKIWLFYTEDYAQDFFPVETALTKSIKGREGYQWITFEFPSGVFPKRIKIRFSNNKDQNSIKLNEIQFSRDNKILKIEGERFVNYFNFSKFIYTLDGYELRLEMIDGVYDPNIVSSSQFDSELIKL
ncbi:hypothetical protein [Yeosuana marina]|uniref:hypothetical protein n=1 Tax=Yeosuana marina TaxID=1565536 RepID=UPI00141D77DC|nr:hypothetical protein [Yeosuana marina]